MTIFIVGRDIPMPPVQKASLPVADIVAFIISTNNPHFCCLCVFFLIFYDWIIQQTYESACFLKVMQKKLNT